MEVRTPFDAALAALLKAWKARDDLRQQGDPDGAAVRAAFVELDRARAWVRKASGQRVWSFDRREDPRTWLSPVSQARIREITQGVQGLGTNGIGTRLDALISRNRRIHRRECVNLNPATNVMNPHAERAMAAGLGTRPSLGHPGEKYETGLEAIEEIEVIAAELCAQVFGATFVEHRVASGSMANLYAFMATCEPGDAIIVPPPEVGGHVTHHEAGAAGLHGLVIHHAPAAGQGYTVDLDGLAALAREVRPRLITLGGSMNLAPHPVAEVRAIADEVGARVLFDAAHVCGLIAGGVWPNPLDEGADLMTMSTYKSLGGPPGGLVVTDDEVLAARIEAIAHPGLTANFDVGTTVALAFTMLDWIDCGRAYAREMVDVARLLADCLADLGLPVWAPAPTGPGSHQLAIDASRRGGGTAMSQHLRRANLLVSAIGLPRPLVADVPGPGVRMGTPEIVRVGIVGDALPQLASFIAQAWEREDPEAIADRVSRFRAEFRTIRHIRQRS